MLSEMITPTPPVVVIDRVGHLLDTFNVSMKVKARNKVGRNEKCPCKSGRKYKNCCMQFKKSHQTVINQDKNDGVTEAVCYSSKAGFSISAFCRCLMASQAAFLKKVIYAKQP